jgi:S1-C subfamily serine protease
MKPLLPAIVLALAAPCSAQLSPVQAQTAVAKVECSRFGVMTCTGTAFFVTPTTLLTAKHMVKTGMGCNMALQVADGREFPLEVVKTGPWFGDWAVLKVNGYRSGHYISVAKSLQDGGACWAYGDFRKAGDPCGSVRLESGYIANVGGLAVCGWYPGFSGGPVVNAKGEAIGIVSAYSGNGMGYFVPMGKVSW